MQRLRDRGIKGYRKVTVELRLRHILGVVVILLLWIWWIVRSVAESIGQ